MKPQPQAIKPDLFANFRGILKSKEAKEKPVEEVEEKRLYELAITDGWIILKKHIENLKVEVDAINQHSMQSGASFEEIGRNAVVIQLTKDLLTKIVNKVEDARESIEQPGKWRCNRDIGL